MRNVAPAPLAQTLRRFDALAVGALAAVVQGPCATTTADEEEVSDWRAFTDTVLAPEWAGLLGPQLADFSEQQQLQMGLRLGHGGLSIKSTEAHAPAAFVGRTITVLEQVLTS